MLDELASSNINKELTNEVEKFISYFTDEKVQELIMCILLKDLRFGMNVKSINKSIPNLIPQHQIMLASKFEGSLKGDVSMSLKLDGIRCSILIDEDIKYLSRQGVGIEGLNEITKALEEFNLEGHFIDGELIRKNIDNLSSDDNFRLTTRIVNSKSNDKIGLEFVIFDIVPIEDYHKGKSKIQYKERLELMEELIGEGNEFIRLVPKFGVTNKVEDVYNKLDEVVANNQEGLMLNTLDGVYGFGKRPKDILKVKKFEDADVLVTDILEGEGRLKGKLGKVEIQFKYKGKIYTNYIGSGFSDEEREYYWDNQDMLIGKIITIKYFELSKNEKGNIGFRFGTWKGSEYIRTDKEGIDDTNV
jgi:DNA ligase-1